jgi:hypothetical protein
MRGALEETEASQTGIEHREERVEADESWGRLLNVRSASMWRWRCTWRETDRTAMQRQHTSCGGFQRQNRFIFAHAVVSLFHMKTKRGGLRTVADVVADDPWLGM